MNQIAKDCAAELERRMIAQEVFEGQVDCEFDDQVKKIYENSDKWVGGWISDPTDLVSQVFAACAAYTPKRGEPKQSDYEMVGKIVFSIFNREVRAAAKYIVESYD